MKSKPLVTVITIFLNAERFLKEAIASVFAQGYLGWELLLVDDGSTDASTAVALQYAERYPNRIRYLEHPGHENRGISASQNLGINSAKGKYIAFLDADDVWLPDKLEQQVAILDSQPEAIMVYGQTQYWYSWTGDVEDSRRDLIIDPGVQLNSTVRPPRLLVRFLREEIPIPCPSDIMVRREGIIEVGGFEPGFRRIFTDQVLYAKLTLKWPVFVSGQRWSRYRKHAGSSVAIVKRSGQMRSARRTYLKWLGRYLDDHGVEDIRVRRAVRSAKVKCLLPALARLQRHLNYRALLFTEGLKRLLRRTLPDELYKLLRTQQESKHARGD